MFRPQTPRERIIHRLKISQGHLKKVISMVMEDSYCIDTLHQSQALQKALKEADYLILENHLKTCASSAIKEGKGDQAIKEVIEVVKKAS